MDHSSLSKNTLLLLLLLLIIIILAILNVKSNNYIKSMLILHIIAMLGSHMS